MITGKIKIEKQDHSKATYSIWRDEIDLWIDWNESASRIERTIRALGRPYMGARTRLVNSALKWFSKNGVKIVSVVTQGRNIAPQKLYQKCGFISYSTMIWYHRWFNRE
jgi:hypothetical protein